MYEDTKIFSEIGEYVSELLGVEIEDVNDIDLIEEPFYMVTVNNIVYTYDINTRELKEGIQAKINKIHSVSITAAEAARETVRRLFPR